MKPLATSQRLFTWLCLLPPRENTSSWEKRFYVAFVLAIVLVVLSAFLSSLLYFINFKSVNMKDSLIALSSVFASVSIANSIVVAFFLHHEIPPLFGKLSDIYEKCMNLI